MTLEVHTQQMAVIGFVFLVLCHIIFGNHFLLTTLGHCILTFGARGYHVHVYACLRKACRPHPTVKVQDVTAVHCVPISARIEYSFTDNQQIFYEERQRFNHVS